MNGYFRAIMNANPVRWEAGKAAYICVNPGVRAHVQLISEILQYLFTKGIVDPQTDPPDRLIQHLTTFIRPITDYVTVAADKQIEQKFSRKFGEGGVIEYQYNLCDLLIKTHKDFGSDEYKKNRANQADARVGQAGRDLEDIQNAVSMIVIETLKRVHGSAELESGEKAFWEIGIESAEIKQNAYKKQQMEPIGKRSPREAYIDFIDFVKIVKQSNNWPHFEHVLNIPQPGEKGKKYYLDWMDRVNELRRVTAHKSPYRTFKEEDFDYINGIKNELFSRALSAGFDL
jgi:hypothetical protein